MAPEGEAEPDSHFMFTLQLLPAARILAFIHFQLLHGSAPFMDKRPTTHKKEFSFQSLFPHCNVSHWGTERNSTVQL